MGVKLSVPEKIQILWVPGRDGGVAVVRGVVEDHGRLVVSWPPLERGL
jgi:hypothetical protein